MRSNSLSQIASACSELSGGDLRRLVAVFHELIAVRETQERILKALGDGTDVGSNGGEHVQTLHNSALPIPPPLVMSDSAGRASATQNIKPMKPPGPGTIRAQVHDVLRSRGECRRREIVEAVAALRKEPVSQRLEKAVGSVLDEPRDHLIVWVRPGVYTLCGAASGNNLSVQSVNP